MDLKLNDEQLQAVVAGAVVNAMSGEDRERLIIESVKYLLAAPAKRNHYDPTPKSPLQQAFESAVYAQAQKMAAQYLAEDPTFNERFKELLVEATNRVFNENREVTVTRIARSISEGVKRDD